jgi:hypothetical protein
MNKFLFFLCASLATTSNAWADSLQLGCVKLEKVCSTSARCVWAGNPGQHFIVDLKIQPSSSQGELLKGSLAADLEGQKFTIEVLQKRIPGSNPINYIHLDLPISKDIVVSSEGLIYSHVKYVNKNFGITIRCSTGI